jgi:RND family efflux transporter MFP subunit
MRRLVFTIFCCFISLSSYAVAQSLPLVEIAEVISQQIPKYYSAPGYTIALNNIEISSKQTGFIKKVLVEAGDIVEKGQLLAIIDETENKQSIEQMKKEVEIARNSVTDAKKDVANFEKLRKRQSVSEEKLRKARLLLAHSKSTLLKAKSKLIETKAASTYLRLTSPEKARVVKRLSDVGDLAIAGKSLMNLEVLTPILFETAIPVQWVDKITKEQSIAVKLNSITGINKEVNAPIAQIITSADPLTQQCTVKLQLPPSLKIPTGVFGKAKFVIKEELVLTIPEKSLVNRVGITGVFRIENSGSKNNKIRFTLVRIGRKYQQQQVILSGLKLGEKVIKSPADKLRDGMTITTSK